MHVVISPSAPEVTRGHTLISANHEKRAPAMTVNPSTGDGRALAPSEKEPGTAVPGHVSVSVSDPANASDDDSRGRPLAVASRRVL